RPTPTGARGRPASARHNAAAARFDGGSVRSESARPPLILCRGLRPSQLVKCLTLAQRLMSTPISPSTCNAVVSSIPSIRVRVGIGGDGGPAPPGPPVHARGVGGCRLGCGRGAVLWGGAGGGGGGHARLPQRGERATARGSG